MITILFFNFILSVDESQFGNGCYCATNPGQCTPYCFCDPYCTQIEKDSFDFTLPQRLTENEVACDINHRIKYFHSVSVASYKAEINGEQVTCYYYKGKINQNQFIKSYSPGDFGLTNFTDAVIIDNTRIELEEFMEGLEPFNTVNNQLALGRSTRAENEQTSRASKYTDPDNGYLRGKPVNTLQDTRLYANGDVKMPVLFGVDSNYIFKFQVVKLNNSSLNNLDIFFNLSHFNILYDSRIKGNIIYNSVNYNSPNADSVDAYWTFFFQKRGTSSDYLYIISKIKSEYSGPQKDGDYVAHLHIKFIEISSEGNDILDNPDTSPFSSTITSFFDAIFTQKEDSLKTAGIIFCIGLLWTIWSYYSFFFSNERVY